MNLNDVHRGIHKYKKRKRVGRGPGSGHGKTCGRGHKGQAARAGWSCPPTFEGGQMPLVRRIPKRGFHNRFAATVAIVNLAQLDKQFQPGEEVNPQSLRGKGLCRGQFDLLKVLGNGELTKSLTIFAHRFSRSALEKIRQAGGQAVVLPRKKTAPPAAGLEGPR
ncbi:MAG: 50S ribosomal protein L15 [Thermoguttaceae bacterium]